MRGKGNRVPAYKMKDTMNTPKLITLITFLFLKSKISFVDETIAQTMDGISAVNFLHNQPETIHWNININKTGFITVNQK